MVFLDPESMHRFAICRNRVRERGYDELIGICKGIVADSNVHPQEAEFLLNWLKAHPDVVEMFPAYLIADRLINMLEDGALDSYEAEELLLLLRETTGEKGQQAKEATPTDLAFNDPPPQLIFARQHFCLTGTFQSGKRRDIEEQLMAFGGIVVDSIIQSHPLCLVVGSLVTKAWIHSTHGRKIEEAVALRDQGKDIVVISENYLWEEAQRLQLLEI